MAKDVKINATEGLVHHPQADMLADNDQLRLQFWNTTPVERKVLTTNQPPTSVMGFDV